MSSSHVTGQLMLFFIGLSAQLKMTSIEAEEPESTRSSLTDKENKI